MTLAETSSTRLWFMQGGGSMGARMRAHDWDASALGSPEGWPETLRSHVRLMLNSAAPAFMVWRAQFAFLCNDAFLPVLAPRHPGALGCSFREVWPEAWNDLGPLMDRAFGGEILTVEDMPFHMTHQGQAEERWFTMSFLPLLDIDGKTAGLLCTCIESTQRLRAERATRSLNASLEQRVASHVDTQRNETFITGVLAASPDCVKILSIDGRLEFMNERGIELNQLPSIEAVLGHEFAALWPEQERDKIRGAVAQAAGGRIARTEGFCPTAKGEPRWWEVSFASFHPEAGPRKLIGVSRDVTERVLAEQARQRAATALHELNVTLEAQVQERTAERNLLASIVESTDTLVMAAALDYTILAINRANADEFERIYGVRPKVGDNMLEILRDQPEHQAQVRAGWARGLTGQAVNIVEDFGDTQRARPHYEIKFRPLYSDRDVLIGCYQFVADVTQRLRDQVSLAETQEALRQSQKLEAIGQLTGGVAHDFNNLLTVIRSSCHLLKRPNLPEDKRTRYIAAISETVDRAAKLTGQLLAFARRQTLKPEVFAVCRSVRALTDMMGTLIGARAHIDIELPDEPCYVNADASQFDTVLVNLTVNARDAMDSEGRIVIKVQSVESIPAMRSHDRQIGSFVAVSVSDTGTGIAPELVERVFEPFFTTKVLGKGTGLGLSQVFGFAKQSGGEVTVVSVQGEGTTFTLYLPRVAAPEQTATAQEPEALVDGHGIRVLVVEDNADVGAFAVQSLSDLGYTTTLAIDGAAALARLAEGANRFDVVFSDVMMPGMSGVELGQEIRRLHHDLPVVLTSGYSHVLAQNGTYGFELLHKPYSVEQLSQMLAKAAIWQRRRRLLEQ